MRKQSLGYVVRAIGAEWLLGLAFALHPSRDQGVLYGWSNLFAVISAEAARLSTPLPKPERNAE